MYKGYVQVTYSSACTTFLYAFLDVSSKGARALVMVDHLEKLLSCSVVTKIKLLIGMNLFVDP